MLSSASIDFDNVEVPESNLIGEPGKGFEYVQKFFTESRIVTAALAVGVARGAYDRAMTHIKGREQFNRPIGAFQAVRHKIADMAANIHLASLMTYDAARCFDKGACDPARSAMAKMTACRSAMRVADEAVQLLGGYGYMREYDVEHYYRDAKMLEIREGSPYLLKDVIAESEIGKLKQKTNP
jgi:alkylation response protein AidB-like acyl-CoA dehydrogenase